MTNAKKALIMMKEDLKNLKGKSTSPNKVIDFYKNLSEKEIDRLYKAHYKK